MLDLQHYVYPAGTVNENITWTVAFAPDGKFTGKITFAANENPGVPKVTIDYSAPRRCEWIWVSDGNLRSL